MSPSLCALTRPSAAAMIGQCGAMRGIRAAVRARVCLPSSSSSHALLSRCARVTAAASKPLGAALLASRFVATSTNCSLGWRQVRRWSTAKSASPSANVQGTAPPTRKPYINPARIQMLDHSVWEQVFPDVGYRDGEKHRPEQLEKIRSHLKDHGLWDAEVPPIRPTDRLRLPPLRGKNLDEHFQIVAAEHVGHYVDSAASFAAATLPPMPSKWVFEPGWTMYTADGQSRPVSGPLEDVFVLDVETCVNEGHYPTLAAAVSENHWYSWVSRRLHDSSRDAQFDTRGIAHGGRLIDSMFGTEELISIGGDVDRPRLMIAHNVAYDRQRILEAYNLRNTGLRFLDTMSLHMAVSGLSSQQAGSWSLRDSESFSEHADDYAHDSTAWTGVSGPPSLQDAYKFWCGEEISKDARNIFVVGTIPEIRADFQHLMTYCASDCDATFRVFQRTYGAYAQNVPSMVSFAGMLEVTAPVMTTDVRWARYLRQAQNAFDRLHDGLDELLVGLADDIVDLVETRGWVDDPWYRNLDWDFETPILSIGDEPDEDGTYTRAAEPSISGRDTCFLPQWYIDLFPEIGKVPLRSSHDITKYFRDRSVPLTHRLLPYLLRMSWTDLEWKGPGPQPRWPLHCDELMNWGYLVPWADAFDHRGGGTGPFEWHAMDGTMNTEYAFFKLPSTGGEDDTVGDVFSKDFLPYARSGRLSSPLPWYLRLYDIVEQTTYWASNRDRIFQQFVVWEHLLGDTVNARSLESDRGFPISELGNHGEIGVLLPTVIPIGTVTRRAVERTWLTAANPSLKAIGSELKSRIVAPKGHKFVGADVDSQELWIAAILGDARTSRMHGSSALGWMTLQGSKADKTDMHSKTAQILGITRDNAKVVNYARIYGAAEGFAAQLLKKFDPTMSTEEASQRARDLYEKTKGRREKLWSASNPTAEVWKGGSESAAFNLLEDIARQDVPTTPVLGATISSSLRPSNFGGAHNQYLRSRINWVVQSSAVDYLHILVLSMADLCKRFDIKARYCISIHDEVRYIVPDEDVDRAALALNISNLYVRAYFAHKLKIQDLPQCVAFFSAIDVDTVLRKEVFMSCVTPSNPHPEPPGRSMDIYECGERCGWSLDKK